VYGHKGRLCDVAFRRFIGASAVSEIVTAGAGNTGRKPVIE